VALESAAVVTLRFTLIKKATIASPLRFCRLRDQQYVSCLATGSSYSSARKVEARHEKEKEEKEKKRKKEKKEEKERKEGKEERERESKRKREKGRERGEK